MLVPRAAIYFLLSINSTDIGIPSLILLKIPPRVFTSDFQSKGHREPIVAGLLIGTKKPGGSYFV